MIAIKYRRLTADKREIKKIPELLSATSFTRNPLGDSILMSSYGQAVRDIIIAQIIIEEGQNDSCK